MQALPKVPITPALQIVVMPLLAYFICALQDSLTSSTPHSSKLLPGLKGRLGPFVLLGLISAVIVGLTSQIPTVTPAQVSAPLGLAGNIVLILFNWIFGLVLNLALWQMSVRSTSLQDALSHAIPAFFSNLGFFVGLTLPCLLWVLPGLTLIGFSGFFYLTKISGGQSASLFVVLAFALSGLVFALSMLTLVAFNVFLCYECGRRLFDKHAVDSQAPSA
jgi:hypothetical protein